MNTYVEFMRQCISYLQENADYISKCPECGGTGLSAIICCDGTDCGCMGQPIDFIQCKNCDTLFPELKERVEP